MNILKRDIRTTMFLPPSKDSELVRGILECEAEQNSNLTTRVKVLEQPGIPLSLSFRTRFPLELGCSKGTKCQICDNKGVKCAPSGVIYRARCKLCKENMKTADTYIKESSRPLRERVTEHMENLWNWRETSLKICHWMDCHATDTSCPEF